MAANKKLAKRPVKEPLSRTLPVMMDQRFKILEAEATAEDLRFGILVLMIGGLLLLAIVSSTSNTIILDLESQLDNCSSNLNEKYLCERPINGTFTGTQGAIKYNECVKNWIDTNMAPEITTIGEINVRK